MSSTYTKRIKYRFVAAFAFALVGMWLFPQQAMAAALEGFHAIKQTGQAVKKTGWVRTTSWTVSGAPGLYQVGTGFNPTTGTFTAPKAGYYRFAAQIIFRDAHGGTTNEADLYVRATIAINANSTQKILGGTHSIAITKGQPLFTIPTGGIVYLAKGHTAYVDVFAQSDNSYTIDKGSTFSGYFIGPTIQHGFHIAPTRTNVTQTGWRRLPGTWKATGYDGLFKSGNVVNLSTGTFTAPVDGYYHFDARTRLDGVTTGATELSIVIDGGIFHDRGLHARATRLGLYQSGQVGGTIYLKKNQTVTSQIYSSSDNNFHVDQESGFSGYLVSTDLKHSFSADHVGRGINGTIYDASTGKLVAGAKGWFHLGRWNTKQPSAILLQKGHSFDSITGTFTAPQTGYYSINAQVLLVHANTGTFTLKAVINNNPAHGLTFALKDPKRIEPSLVIAGIVKLQKGDSVRLWVHSDTDKDFTLHTWSGFSMALLQAEDTDLDGVPDHLDCQPNDKTIYPAYKHVPAARERCNGKDDDCDGKAESVGASCTIPNLKGACAKGIVACDASRFVYCKANAQSTVETCSGKDDNCDGIVDNVPQLGEACQHPTNKGACQAGLWKCQNNKKECVPNNKPKTEVCSGKDDDCNGKVDDVTDAGKPCTDGARKGECQAGFWACAQNKRICQQSKTPTPEECDGKDSDCDGKVDNIRDAGTLCLDRSKKGECQAGKWACQNNKKVCEANTQPTKELCNGKDDDCDGTIDNLPELGKACQNPNASGECKAGTWVCSNLKLSCKSDKQPATEICNGKDDDCNGKPDDVAGVGNSCLNAAQKGECQLGLRTCQGNKVECVPINKPGTEVCDQKDNDCDGQVDNGIKCNDTSPKNRCDTTNPCKQGEKCVDGFCQPDSCDKVTCPEGQFCKAGKCVTSCACKTCPKGQSCRDGACQKDPCAGVSCKAGEVCHPFSGQCIVDPCKANTCKQGESCVGGACVADPCAVVKCFAGEVCSKGQCYGKSCVPKIPTQESPPTPDAGPTPDNVTPPKVGCHAVPGELPVSVFFVFLLLLLPLRKGAL